jgi:DeoR/GlpR family transcriptional regulator of sugar metabolism
MDYITYSERLDYILDLIKKESLCSPKEIAERFQCSEKTVRNMINCLREKGFEIDYCKCNKKYFLKN